MKSANDPAPKTGILLVNLGTPSAPTPKAVRRYLAEFLSDRRVVDYPRFLWLPLLYGLILNVRPARTARNYAKIWLRATDESPLRYFTRRQAENLKEELRGRFVVDWAMRYGEPSIADRLEAMRAAGVGQVVVIPLYPQYSASTNASIADTVATALKERATPAAGIGGAFHDHPRYVAALAARARASLDALGWAPQRIVLSFHSLPERFIRAGDPYRRQCEETATLLRSAMGWSEEFAPLAYQSRFGSEKWLGPPTEETLARLAAQGFDSVAVMTPGFVADCIETLEEIAMGGRDTFLKSGGKRFAALECLNDSAEMTGLLVSLVERESGAQFCENRERLHV